MSDSPAQNEVATLPAGAVPGRNGGHLVPVRNSEQARELAAMRWDAVSRAARRGIANAGKQITGIDTQGPIPVVAYLVEQHAMNAADPSAPGSVQSFREVMRIAYPAPNKDNSQSSVPAGGASINLSPELARELLGELRARRGG